MTLFLIRAACPHCADVVELVEKTSEPVGLMQDVAIETRWCPSCGDPVGIGCWDVHEEAEIEWVE